MMKGFLSIDLNENPYFEVSRKITDKAEKVIKQIQKDIFPKKKVPSYLCLLLNHPKIQKH